MKKPAPVWPNAGRKDQPLNAETPRHRGLRRFLFISLLAAGLVAGVVWLWPRTLLFLNTVSTDDAYVAGYITSVAPRVPGTIAKIHVDDNMFASKGQLLVELDPEPYQIAVNRSLAAVRVAEAQVKQATAQGRAVVAGIRAAYNNLTLARDQVAEQIAKLKASMATLSKAQAQRVLAETELRRAQNLFQSKSGTQQSLDQRQASYQVALATELEAHEQIHLNRAALGLPPVPAPGQPLDEVPAGWTKKAPMVRAALAELINTAVKIGLEVPRIEEDPDTVYNNFVKRAPGGNLDALLDHLVETSPATQLAQAGMEQARRA